MNTHNHNYTPHSIGIVSKTHRQAALIVYTYIGSKGRGQETESITGNEWYSIKIKFESANLKY